MNLLILSIGLLFLAERIGKYLAIENFFQREDEIDRSTDPLVESQVSILQPILSGDPTLWDCLAGNLQMTTSYPTEFLWLIDDDDAEAQIGCRQLIDRYPDVSVKLISLPQAPARISPKMFKLIEGLQQAQGQIIAVLDDDTTLPDRGLDRAIPFLDRPAVGVAFGLPYYLNFSNTWSALVSCVVNSSSLLTYVPYTFLTAPFTINGMFFVMKREVLDRVDGFSGLETSIVDDFAIAKHFRSHGYLLAQTPVCHGISTKIKDANHYFSLLNRWFIFPQESILKSISIRELAIFYSTALISTFIPTIVVGYLVLFPSMSAAIYTLIYFGVNAYILTQFNTKYLNKATPDRYILLLLAIQLIMPLHIILALLSPRRIEWRGKTIELNADGSFEIIKQRSAPEI
ncbi:glycosyltransferase family 2 protein [Chamaesiphon polymorphus]|uniref:Glycosyl transferase n=1 Tax=Chamaesiphon polymorphus CCALA 037 TaxID=2107692 RepID=A0A2T1FYK8_9CYAN|nr:glycosyltransferase family 2 protein [Chamaesiphon polymorphus]PSB50079.1 glycosyl transferase [Chamaesiphon polymorphus CCALA 037]